MVMVIVITVAVMDIVREHTLPVNEVLLVWVQGVIITPGDLSKV